MIPTHSSHGPESAVKVIPKQGCKSIATLMLQY